jgi:hypothetical protein
MGSLPAMITRRNFLTGSLAATASLPLFAAPKGPIGKKGWAGGKGELPTKFNAHWYYNWMVRPGEQKQQFVPLFKGGDTINENAFDVVRKLRGIDSILGFNEPERADQGNLTVNQVLDLWPQLVKLAERMKVRLGSPACSSDKKGMDWFAEFMEKAKKKELHMDFVAVHWYRSRDANAFEEFVEDLSKTHGRRKVWITEFNGWAGDEKENFSFLKDSLKFLEKNPVVERYAYFNPAPGKPHSLLNEDGTLTRMGELYRDAGV